MPYLGQKPKDTFTSSASQTITGTGATAYSLNQTVTSAEDIEVFINNVQQQPTVAYTVSGQTITFDEALLSTDSCYVVFRGARVESRTHPASTNLQAADVTASGNATVTGDLTVDTNTLKVDATNNRVLIGTNTEGSVGANQLTVADSSNCGITIRAGTSSSSALYFSDGTTGTDEYDGYIAYSHSARTMYQFAGINYGLNIDGVNKTIRVTDGGTQKLRISNNGINFGADTAADNALDYYEEGTWTPSFVGATNQGTFYNKVGRFTRIGRLVVIQFFYQVGATRPTFSNNASQFLISGIPFSVASSGYTGSQGSVNAQAFNYTSTYNNQGMGADYLSASINGSEQMFFNTTNSGQTRGIVNNLSANSSHWIVEATVSYFTDA